MNKNIIAWLHSEDTLHTYGIEILANNYLMYSLDIERIIINICARFDCKYFIQEKRKQTESKKTSWLFIEFFGESNHDKIIKVIDEISIYYHNELYNHSVLWDEPTRELLTQLELF